MSSEDAGGRQRQKPRTVEAHGPAGKDREGKRERRRSRARPRRRRRQLRSLPCVADPTADTDSDTEAGSECLGTRRASVDAASRAAGLGGSPHLHHRVGALPKGRSLTNSFTIPSTNSALRCFLRMPILLAMPRRRTPSAPTTVSAGGAVAVSSNSGIR